VPGPQGENQRKTATCTLRVGESEPEQEEEGGEKTERKKKKKFPHGLFIREKMVGVRPSVKRRERARGRLLEFQKKGLLNFSAMGRRNIPQGRGEGSAMKNIVLNKIVKGKTPRPNWSPVRKGDTFTHPGAKKRAQGKSPKTSKLCLGDSKSRKKKLFNVLQVVSANREERGGGGNVFCLGTS